MHPDINVTIISKSCDKVLAKKKAMRVNPGEMEHIDFNTADVTGDAVTVSVVKEA